MNSTLHTNNFYLAQLVGAFPFCLKDGKFEINPFLSLYVILIHTLFAIRFTTFFIFPPYIIDYSWRFHFYATHIYLLILYISTLISIICTSLSRQKLNSMFRLIKNVDMSLYNFRVRLYYPQTMFHDVLIVIYTSFPALIRIAVSPKVQLMLVVDLAYMFMVALNIFYSTLTFVRTLNAISLRFAALNKYLQSSSVQEMEKLLILHSKLSKCCYWLNNTYMFQITTTFASIFASISIGCYLILSPLLSGNINAIVLFIKTVATSSHVIYCGCIISSCENLYKQVCII